MTQDTDSPSRLYSPTTQRQPLTPTSPCSGPMDARSTSTASGLSAVVRGMGGGRIFTSRGPSSSISLVFPKQAGWHSPLAMWRATYEKGRAIGHGGNGGGGSHTSDASDDPGVTTNKKSVRFAKNRGVDKVPGRKRQHSCVSPNRDPFMNIICVIRIPADGAGGGKLASAELEAGPRARTVDRMDGLRQMADQSGPVVGQNTCHGPGERVRAPLGVPPFHARPVHKGGIQDMDGSFPKCSGTLALH